MTAHRTLFKQKGFSREFKKYKKKYRPLINGACSDEDYYEIIKHLKTRTGIKAITDIGISNSFQNFLFRDYKYIGINSHLVYGSTDKYDNLIKKIAKGEILTTKEEDEFISIINNKENYKEIPFFREDTNSADLKFYIGHFPNDLIDEMVGDCFILNKNIGYGKLQNTTKDDLIKAFSKFSFGYAQTTDEIHSILLEIFSKRTKLKNNKNLKNIYFYQKTI